MHVRQHKGGGRWLREVATQEGEGKGESEGERGRE